MSLRLIITLFIILLTFGCSEKKGELTRDGWLALIQSETLASIIAEIEQRNIRVEDETSILLEAAIISQQIDLLDYLYEQGGLSRSEILNGYKNSIQLHQDIWQYLLRYDEVKTDNNYKLPTKYYNEKYYFPDFVLRFRLLSEPNSRHFSERHAINLVQNSFQYYEDIWGSQISYKHDWNNGREALLRQLKKHYDIEHSPYAKFIFALTILYHEKLEGRDFVPYSESIDEAMVMIMELSEQNYAPAIYFIADNTSEFSTFNSSYKGKQLKLLKRAALLGHEQAQSDLLNHYHRLLNFSDDSQSDMLFEVSQSPYAYQTIVSKLLNSDHPMEVKNKAAKFFLEAIKVHGYSFDNLDERKLIKLGIKAKVEFLEGFIIQGDYERAEHLALNIINTADWQQDLNLKHFLSLIINSALVNNGPIMAPLIIEVDFLKYPESVEKLNSKVIIAGSSLLSYVIKSGRYQLALKLLETTELMEEKNLAFPSLFFAIKSKNKQLINKLLSLSNADIYQSSYGYSELSLLHIAINNADLSLVKQLVKNGVPLHMLDRHGLTALDWAIKLKQENIVNYLANEMNVENVEIAVQLNQQSKDCLTDDVSKLVWLNKKPLGSTVLSWQSQVQIKEPDKCALEACTLLGVVNYLNSIKYCERDDWRVPSAEEMMSINDEMLDYLKGEPGANYFVVNDFGSLEILNITQFSDGMIKLNQNFAHVWPVAGDAEKLPQNLSAHRFSFSASQL